MGGFLRPYRVSLHGLRWQFHSFGNFIRNIVSDTDRFHSQRLDDQCSRRINEAKLFLMCFFKCLSDRIGLKTCRHGEGRICPLVAHQQLRDRGDSCWRQSLADEFARCPLSQRVKTHLHVLHHAL